MEYQTVKQNLSRGPQWIRLLYMLLFAVVLYLLLMVLSVVVVVQIIFALFTGEAHPKLREFSKTLALYLQQIVEFLTYNINHKPFPFNPITPTDADDDVIIVDEFEDLSDTEHDTQQPR